MKEKNITHEIQEKQLSLYDHVQRMKRRAYLRKKFIAR